MFFLLLTVTFVSFLLGHGLDNWSSYIHWFILSIYGCNVACLLIQMLTLWAAHSLVITDSTGLHILVPVPWVHA